MPLISLGNHTNEIILLKPVGPGHAIAHYSNATFLGIRDILVIFLMVTHKCGDVKSTTLVMQCKIKSRRSHLWFQVYHLGDELIDDGEAWHYLGMTLLDCNDHFQLSTDNSTVELGVSCVMYSRIYQTHT